MANTITSADVFFAFVGGLLPALLWLWFWLREDLHPEPRRILFLTFIAGMMMAILALFLEQGANILVTKWLNFFPKWLFATVLLFVWAAIEEIVKYIAARRAALRLPSFDEPVDALIYLVTAALGFAALENILFLLKVSGSHGMLAGLITGNLRFLGATLLHVICSAMVGVSVAFSFFHKEKLIRNVLGGLLFATILHTLFNFFIINGGDSNLFKILVPLWLAVVILFFIFEKIKGLKKNNF